jgi:CMP-N-acetylneuraminic acid synthetase
MVVLQPTSPLRDYKDINNAVRIVKKKKYKSLFSISESLEHPYECIKIEKNGKWKYVLDKSKLFYRRQDFDFKSYFINGAIYIIHKELITKKKIYDNKKHGLFLMRKYRSIDINDINEIKITESLLMKK